MKLATYISDLLYRYECVIIPEFGALLTQRQSASINEDTHTFYPPRKVLSFNQQLQKNDGLLANYILGVEKCSYTDALSKIQQFTEYLQHELNTGKEIILDQLGTFQLTTEKTICFDPEQKVNYLADSFGLDAIKAQPLKILPKREVLKTEVEKIEEKAPIAITPEKRKSLPYWKYAVTAAAIVVGLGFLGIKQYSNSIATENNSVALEVNEEVRNEISKAGFIFETEDTLPIVSVLVHKSKAEGKYLIIAGAYRIPKNAEKKVLQLQHKGFDAYIMAENPYGLHQVVYASYDDKYEALRELRRIKRTYDYNSWLFVQE